MNQTTRKQQLEQTIKDAKSEISDINRDEKAEQLVCGVSIVDSQIATVKSGDKIYTVNYISQTCDCEDCKYRSYYGIKCKHIRAVNIVLFEIEELVKVQDYYEIPQKLVIAN